MTIFAITIFCNCGKCITHEGCTLDGEMMCFECAAKIARDLISKPGISEAERKVAIEILAVAAGSREATPPDRRKMN